jgi:hypothetical protein
MLTILTWISAISLAITGLAIIYGRVLKPLCRGCYKIYILVDAIHSQFYKNGGKSLIDRIDRQDKMIAKQNRILLAIAHQIEMPNSELKHFETEFGIALQNPYP